MERLKNVIQEKTRRYSLCVITGFSRRKSGGKKKMGKIVIWLDIELVLSLDMVVADG